MMAVALPTCGCGESLRISPDELANPQRRLPRQLEHLVRPPVVPSREMQIGHRRQMVPQMNRLAALEQSFPPRLNRDALKGDCSAKSFRILPGIEMHVLRLRAGQVIDL